MLRDQRKDSLTDSHKNVTTTENLSLIPPLHLDAISDSGPESNDLDAALKQDYPAPFEDEQGDCYLSAEHYVLYHKAHLAGDTTTAHELLHAASAAEVTQLGRQIELVTPDVWEQEADRVVEHANWLKFSHNKDLGKVLLATGSRRLGKSDMSNGHRGGLYGIEGQAVVLNGVGDGRVGRALERVRDRLGRDEKDGKWPWLKVA